MKKLLIVAIGVIVVLGVLLFQQMKKHDSPTTVSKEQPAKDEPSGLVMTNGEKGVQVSIETQKLMGLQTAVLSEIKVHPEVTGFGRVLDPVVFSTVISDFLGARATADVSEKELARQKLLTEQKNGSARTLEAAIAAAQRDTAVMEASRAKLIAGFGATLVQRADFTEFTKRLVSSESALVKIDWPMGEPINETPGPARLVTLDKQSQPIEADFAGLLPAVDPQTQSRGILFLVETNQPRLASGETVTAFIKAFGDLQAGVVVAREAIIRFKGTDWVYLQTGDTTFERVEVKLAQRLDSGWFSRSDELKAGAKMVVVGAQQLLSEELKSSDSAEN